MTDWDNAFDNFGHIADAATFPARWAALAEAYRRTANFAELDIPYGEHPRERFDLFHADGVARGLAIFVHGGYWRRFDKSYWSHLAKGARDLGLSVAIPSYVLAPEARIAEITRRFANAISTAAECVDGPVTLIGHSAGGHLVLKMICEGSPLPTSEKDRIERVVSISGVHDLTPLVHTRMNEDLKLTVEESREESPALLSSTGDVSVMAWVGGEERPEFIRQSRLLYDAWSRADVNIGLVVEPDLHHFDVIDGLASRKTKLCEALGAANRSWSYP